MNHRSVQSLSNNHSRRGYGMKRKLVFVSIGTLFALLMIFSVGFAQQAPIKLTYATYFIPQHKTAVLDQEFCDEIKKRTNGRVEIQFFPSATLLTAPKMYQGIVSGIADIGFAHIAYTRGRFPVSEVSDLPLGFPSGFVSTKVVSDFYNKFQSKEWNDVKPLYFSACGPNIIYTATKPVRNMEDMKGLKIRSYARQAEIIKLLGGTPVPLDFGELYEALRKGVLDGGMGPWEQMKQWKMAEVSKAMLNAWPIGSVFTFYCIMNKEKWNSLPDDIKKIFEQVSKEWVEKRATTWNEIDVDALEYTKTLNREIVNLPQAEAAKWKKAVEPVIEDYKKDLESKGISRAEADGYVNFARERIEYWSKEEKRLGTKTIY